MASKFSCDACPQKATCVELCTKLIRMLPTAEPAKDLCINRREPVDAYYTESASLGDHIDTYGKMAANSEMSLIYQGLTPGEKRVFNTYLSSNFEKPLRHRPAGSMKYPIFADFVRCKEITRVAKSAGTTPQNAFKLIQSVIRASGKMTARNVGQKISEEHITPLSFKKRFYEGRVWENAR